MKLKMAENSLFAILLRSPWWISLLLVGVISLASRALLPAPYVPFGMMGALPFLVIAVIAARRQWRAPSPAKVAEVLARVGAMSWREFADLIDQRFTSQGYTVTRLDRGAADFSLSRGGRVTLVSCKRWKAVNQGVEVLRDLVAAKDRSGADQCIFISLGLMSDNAHRFAREQRIQLLSESELARLLVG